MMINKQGIYKIEIEIQNKLLWNVWILNSFKERFINNPNN
jgi:hypothetical protein